MFNKENFKRKLYSDYNKKTYEEEPFFQKDIHFSNNNILKKFSKIAAVFVLGLVGTTVWAGVSGKLNLNLDNIGYQKVQQNYEENAHEVDETIDNDYFTLSFESLAVDNTYIITQYKVLFKDKYFEETGGFSYSEELGYSFEFNGDILTNNVKKFPKTSIKKISDNQFLYMNFIDISDIKEETNVKLAINLEKLHSTKNDDRNIYQTEEGINYYNNHYFEKEIGKTIEVIINLPEKEDPKIIAEQKLHDDTTIQLLKIGNTSFENYIRIRILKSGTWSMTQDINKLESFSYDITDENGNHIRFLQYPENTIFYDGNSGELLELSNDKKVEVDQPIIMEDNYFIRLESDINPKQLNIQPYHMYAVNKQKEGQMIIEANSNANWYDVEQGEKEYKATSSKGDILTITKTEIDDETITFYYELKGNFPNGLGVVIKNKTFDKINYTYESRYEIKGLNSNENKIVFDRRWTWRSGLNTTRDMLDDISQLQFAMLFLEDNNFEPIGNVMTVDFPKQNKNTGEIISINVFDL